MKNERLAEREIIKDSMKAASDVAVIHDGQMELT